MWVTKQAAGDRRQATGKSENLGMHPSHCESEMRPEGFLSPAACRLSPAVHFLEITSITPPKWFEPHLSCASDAL